MTYFYSFPNVCIRFRLNIELLPHLMKSPDIKSKILQSEANHQHLRTTPGLHPGKIDFDGRTSGPVRSRETIKSIFQTQPIPR
jgi:hypothetical protein